MVRKQIDSSVLQEIIQWEEEFWGFYQKEVEEISQLFQQDIKSEGLEVVAERFWNNAYDRKYREEKHERIEFLPGYTYFCRYSIQKDGKLYWLKGADDEYSCCTLAITRIRSRHWLPGVCYRHGIYNKKWLYIEISVDKRVYFETMKEMMEEQIDGIKKGTYEILPYEGTGFLSF